MKISYDKPILHVYSVLLRLKRNPLKLSKVQLSKNIDIYLNPSQIQDNMIDNFMIRANPYNTFNAY